MHKAFSRSGSKICKHQNEVNVDQRSANMKHGKLTGCAGRGMIPKQVTQRVCQASIRANKKRGKAAPFDFNKKEPLRETLLVHFLLLFLFDYPENFPKELTDAPGYNPRLSVPVQLQIPGPSDHP